MLLMSKCSHLGAFELIIDLMDLCVRREVTGILKKSVVFPYSVFVAYAPAVTASCKAT